MEEINNKKYIQVTVDELIFIFPTDATDVVVNNLKQSDECKVWGCISCRVNLWRHLASTPSLIARIVRPTKGCVIDIGCHIGTVTLPLAKMGYTVLAIDGSADSKECIDMSKIKNNLYDIGTLTAILSNREYECGFSSKASPYNAIDSGSSNRTTTLDKLLKSITNNTPPQVSFIKIDVEGHEKEVLEGSVGILESQTPNLCLEINTHCLHRRDIKPTDIFSYLNSLNYELYIPNLDSPLDPYLRRFEPTNSFPFTVENIFALHESYDKSELHIPIKDDWTQDNSDSLLEELLNSLTEDSPFYKYMTSLSSFSSSKEVSESNDDYKFLAV